MQLSIAPRLQCIWLACQLRIFGVSSCIIIIDGNVYSVLTSRTHHSDQIHDKVLLDYCDAGQLWDPVLSAYFYHMDPDSSTLTRLFLPGSTASSDSNLTSFFYFSGIWGDTEYSSGDARQKIVPVFGLKRFVSGPQGPLWKQLVREGLFPDHPAPQEWVQWAVGILMSWYPCCLRGWRVLVSLTVVIVAIILTVLAVKKGFRRFKRKGYRRVDTEIPLDDLDPEQMQQSN